MPASDITERALDEALDSLRANGHRVTTARRAVIRVLLASDHEMSASQVADAIGRTHPATHLSTVYRTLESLEGAGIVVHVHSHGGLAFHLAERHHQHAECDTCGTVIDLPRDVLADVAARLEADHDFTLDTQHFPLVGRCSACRKRKGTTPHRHAH